MASPSLSACLSISLSIFLLAMATSFCCGCGSGGPCWTMTLRPMATFFAWAAQGAVSSTSGNGCMGRPGHGQAHFWERLFPRRSCFRRPGRTRVGGGITPLLLGAGMTMRLSVTLAGIRRIINGSLLVNVAAQVGQMARWQGQKGRPRRCPPPGVPTGPSVQPSSCGGP